MQPTPLYVIGDIHGQKEMLDHALGLIAADGGPDAQIVFLGDYTDRGPNSKGVIETLLAGRDAGKPWTFIKGNHDKMFAGFVTTGQEHDPRVKSQISWINRRLGGITTLASYGVEGMPQFAFQGDGREVLKSYTLGDRIIDPATVQAQAQGLIPDDHIAFLQNLPLTHETDDLLFVHAGLRPGIPLDQQDPEDLIWIRDGFLENRADFGKLVVHGHTALDAPQHYGNRVNLDGGAGYGRQLVPAVFEGRDCWLLTPAGRQSLRP
jgi:serine/threonine protein phosphatase 1